MQGTSPGGRKRPLAPDWSKFGLSQEPVKPTHGGSADAGLEAGYQHVEPGNKNELFQEDQVILVLNVARGRGSFPYMAIVKPC
ncbi:hypothetical protein DPMN_158997 [Dreissena polymorpha]|uniref:Uncharacterized protein n=1 Tax=Dreissena polymorpha TaxID=45954 RepID=A0A9D4EK77_DREPO|nr:hypothetical protein DPMN_158997 [Dreissena polymorpha]